MFTLSIPREHHSRITATLETFEQVVLNDDKKSGILVDPETGGVVKFRLSEETVIFHVVHSKGLSEDQIKAAIQGHVEQIK